MKKIGACTICDDMVFNVLERFQEGHPLSGQIRKISSALKDRDAKRVSLLQLGSPENEGLKDKFRGSQVEITLCGKCRVTPENIVSVWKKCMESYAYTSTPWYNDALGKPPMTPEQELLVAKMALWMIRNIPVGVLHEQKWTEVS